jgi:outer membrane protein TolC
VSTATGGFNYFRELNKSINQQAFPNFPIYTSVGEGLGTRQFGATATQTLFNGFQTANRTRQAESQVMGARVGQRTTPDVLNTQQEPVNARVALVTAQHDRVVASYTLLAAVGGLSMQRLGLNVMVYDPQVQVRDAWICVRTPDGR